MTKLTRLIGAVAIWSLPLNVFAASIQDLKFLGSGTTIPEIIGNLIKSLFGVAGSIALLLFIWGGFTVMTAGGSEEKVKKGKKTVVNAVIGIAAMFFSYTMLDFILRALSTTVGAK